MRNGIRYNPPCSINPGAAGTAMLLLIAFVLSIAGTAGAQPTEILGPGLDSGRTPYFQTWNRILSSDTTYILTGLYYVDSTFTLTIPAGTVVKGDTAAALIIRRGGRIYATGDACNPIVFTSNFDPGSRDAGDWAGVTILGEAPVNKTEPAIPGGLGYSRFGGNSSNDSSGIFEYVRIEFAGYSSTDFSMNGLMLGGVGRGTSVHHVQVSYSSTDAFACYGGTVDLSYLVSLACTGDDLFTNLGYRGTIQFFFGLRDENRSDSSGMSRGLESQNDGSPASTDTPYTKPVISNATIVGPERTNALVPMPALETFDFSAVIMRSSQLCLYNSVIMGWPYGLSINDATTQQLAQNDSLQWRNVSIQATLEPVPGSGSVHNEQQWSDVTVWFDTFSWSNIGSSPRNPDALLIGDLNDVTDPDAVPQPGSELIGSADFSNPNLTGFTTTTYRGAFDPGLDMSQQWTRSWANFDPQITDYTDTINVPSADYPDIQSGLDAASCGTTVLVAPGIYTGANNRNLDPKGKNLELRSQSGALVTIIDCQNAGAGFIINNGSGCTPVIDGFTVTNGQPNLLGVAVRVGPIPSLVTFRNCLFTGNTSVAPGSGIVRILSGAPDFEYCTLNADTAGVSSGIILSTGGNPYFYNCTVASNVADRAVRLAGGSPWLQECTINFNTANVALVTTTAATITVCNISDNSNTGMRFPFGPPSLVDSTIVARNGGPGINIRINSSQFLHSTIIQNTGGGVVFDPDTVATTVAPSFQHCFIQGNTSPPVVQAADLVKSIPSETTSDGSGVRLDCSLVDASGALEPTFEYCTITGNASSGDGGGVYICGQTISGGVIAPVFSNCTISANATGDQGGGVYMDIVESTGGVGSALFELTILYNNCAYGTGDAGDEAWISSENEASFWCCNLNQSGMVGTGISTTEVVDGNPLFCEMAFCDLQGTLEGDFALVVNSPASEGGSPCDLLIGAHTVECSEPAVGVKDVPLLPAVTKLYQNEPNPFNPLTSIRFDLAERSMVNLRIYDVAGRLIRVLVDQLLPQERHVVQWDGTNEQGESVASGIYFVRLVTPRIVQTRKIALLK